LLRAMEQFSFSLLRSLREANNETNKYLAEFRSGVG